MLPGSPYAVIAARLDGQAASLLLDTGDTRLVVSPAAQRTLRLPKDNRRFSTVRGIGGESTSFDAVLQRLEIGDTEIPQNGVTVGNVPLLARVDPPLAGILGGQVMSGYDVELDFSHRHVRFWERSDCNNVLPAWTGPYTSARLARGAGNLLTLDVSVNGQTMRALLATGTDRTTLSNDAATRAGMGAALAASTRIVVSRGMDGTDISERATRADDLSVGGVHHTNMAILVAPRHYYHTDMLLGVDFFHHQDVWISYGSNWLYLR